MLRRFVSLSSFAVFGREPRCQSFLFVVVVSWALDKGTELVVVISWRICCRRKLVETPSAHTLWKIEDGWRSGRTILLLTLQLRPKKGLVGSTKNVSSTGTPLSPFIGIIFCKWYILVGSEARAPLQPSNALNIAWILFSKHEPHVFPPRLMSFC